MNEILFFNRYNNNIQAELGYQMNRRIASVLWEEWFDLDYKMDFNEYGQGRI